MTTSNFMKLSWSWRPRFAGLRQGSRLQNSHSRLIMCIECYIRYNRNSNSLIERRPTPTYWRGNPSCNHHNRFLRNSQCCCAAKPEAPTFHGRDENQNLARLKENACASSSPNPLRRLRSTFTHSVSLCSLPSTSLATLSLTWHSCPEKARRGRERALCVCTVGSLCNRAERISVLAAYGLTEWSSTEVAMWAYGSALWSRCTRALCVNDDDHERSRTSVLILTA
jgi:hypothetical protein